MTRILDTSAVLAYFLDELGGEEIGSILLDFESPRCVHSVNWVEIFYKMRERIGEAAAESSVAALRLIKVAVIDIPGENFLRRAADIKNAHPYLFVGRLLRHWLGWMVERRGGDSRQGL